MSNTELANEVNLRHVRRPLPHDSAFRHVQGNAPYIDDMPEPEGTLHLALGGSPVARGNLKSLDVSAVKAFPGVVAVITAADLPGPNDISPSQKDEPAFVADVIDYHEQPVFAVVATSRDIARRAAKHSRIEVDRQTPKVTVDQGLASGRNRLARIRLCRGRRQGGHRAVAGHGVGGSACRWPGTFLPGRADYAGHPQRRKRDAGALLDAASVGSAACRCPRAGCPRRIRYLPGAPHGWWFRRQGIASNPVGE